MRPHHRHHATSAIDFLQHHEAAAGLLPAAQRILKLRQDLFDLMPASLRSACEVSGFDDEIVAMKVSSAGAAAKLRQTLPRLRDGLLDRGWQVNAIRIRVQPRVSPAESTVWISPSEAAIPPGGIAAFAELGERLEDSPLKAAVDRLVKRRIAGR